MKKSKSYCKRALLFWRWVFCAFYQDHCIVRASALTFSSLLALVPFITIVFSVFSISPFFKQVSTELQSFIFQNFVPSTGEVVEKYITGFVTQASSLPIYGFIFLIVTALMMLVTLENTLNAIWKVRYRRRLRGSILLYWALLTLGPLLLGLSLLFSSYLASISWIHGIHLNGFHSLIWLLPFVCEVLAFTFLYMVVPHSPVKLNHAFLGALVASVLFEIAKHLFGFYISNFPTYKLLYGALAAIPIFLLWVYFSWMIFLLGAEVVNGLRFSQAERSVRKLPLFLIAYRVLARLYAAQEQGRAYNFAELLNVETSFPVMDLKRVLSKLMCCKLIYASDDGDYVLNCDVHKISLHTLYLKLGWFMPEEVDIKSLSTDKYQLALSKVVRNFSKQNKTALDVKLSELFAD